MIKKFTYLFMLNISIAESAFHSIDWADNLIKRYAGPHIRRPLSSPPSSADETSYQCALNRLRNLQKEERPFVNEMAAYLSEGPNKEYIWVLSYLALLPSLARPPFKSLLSHLFNPARREQVPSSVRRFLMTRVLYQLCYMVPSQEDSYKQFCTDLEKEIHNNPFSLKKIKSLQEQVLRPHLLKSSRSRVRVVL